MSKRTYEAWRSAGLFEAGMGYVAVFREKSNGDVEAGVFLVDVFCLGVKDGFFTQSSAAERGALLERIFRDEAREPISAACARKLVDDAIAYAGGLGLAPHPDYKKAARVLGGIDPRECETTFTFGKDGKPLYVQGPHDSPAFVAHVMTTLHRRCGEGNYHYLIEAGSEHVEADGEQEREQP
jgi:hypothetical protein